MLQRPTSDASHSTGWIALRFIGVWLVVGPLTVAAQDWPQWRGPQRNAHASAKGILKDWTTASPKLRLHADGLGGGYASLAIRDGRAVTIGQKGTDCVCLAVDANTGTQLWQTVLGATSRNPKSTPTIHDGRVYALDPDGDLACIDVMSGDVVWRHHYVEDFGGRMQSGRGYGESPLVDGGKLIVTPGGGKALVVALDRKTGDVIWKTKEPSFGEKGGDGAGFSSPQMSTAGGVAQYVQLVGRGLIGVSAATGDVLWTYNDIANPTANIPTPVVSGDYVFAANGYNAGSVLLKIVPASDGGGGVTAQEVYRLKGNRFQNHHGGSILVGDHIFGGHGSNNGLPTCLEFQTGRVVWKRRGPGVGSAAVVYTDGHLVFRYQNGLVALVRATADGYQLKGTVRIPGAGGDSWSHPAIAYDRLYLREKDELWVYDLKNGEPVARTATQLAGVSREIAKAMKANGFAVRATSTLAKAEPLYAFAVDRSGRRAQVAVSMTNRHFSADGLPTATAVSTLRKLGTPFVVEVADTRISDDGVRQILSVPGVVGFNAELCRNLTDRALTALGDSSNISLVVLTGSAVGAEGLTHLAQCPSLQALGLEVCDNVSDAACGALAQLVGLKALVLKKTGFEVESITDKGFTQLGTLKKLEYLNVYANRISNTGLATLQSFAGLRRADLSLLAIDDEGLAALQTLRKLEHLDLLYSVGFGGPMVTDAGLPSLARLSNLRHLNLTGAKVTDNGLGQLASSRQLVQLRLIGSQVSPRGVRELQKALPKCRIVYQSETETKSSD